MYKTCISFITFRKASWCKVAVLQVWGGSYSLWPATAKQPQSAISTKLMDLICRLNVMPHKRPSAHQWSVPLCLQRFAHSSLFLYDSSFNITFKIALFEMLIFITILLFVLQCHGLYGILFNESYEEYRHMRYQFSTLQHLVPEISDGKHCPLCPQVWWINYMLLLLK